MCADYLSAVIAVPTRLTVLFIVAVVLFVNPHAVRFCDPLQPYLSWSSTDERVRYSSPASSIVTAHKLVAISGTQTTSIINTSR